MIDLIIERIKELCEEKGISYYRLAKLSHISPNTLNYIMSKRNTDIKFATLERLCDGLGITVKDFFCNKKFN